VGLSAKKIQLTEGAAQGKVLTSDANGNASWGDSAGGDGYEFPFPIYTQSINATGLITASCPPDYPIMLSAGGQCSNPSQIQEMYVAFVGNPTSPGNMQMRCTKADQGGSAVGTTATARPVCAKPSNWTYQTPPAQYQPTWHTTLPDNNGTKPLTPGATTHISCIAWLGSLNSTNQNPSFSPLTSTVRAVDVDSPNLVQIGGCAYQGFTYDSSGNPITYCTFRGATTSGVFQGPDGTAHDLYPVASCEGIDANLSQSSGNIVRYRTEVKW
jgi:hypothetical protein